MRKPLQAAGGINTNRTETMLLAGSEGPSKHQLGRELFILAPWKSDAEDIGDDHAVTSAGNAQAAYLAIRLGWSFDLWRNACPAGGGSTLIYSENGLNARWHLQLGLNAVSERDLFWIFRRRSLGRPVSIPVLTGWKAT